MSKKPMQKPNEDGSTTTPFGRAFYLGKANYFVFPYFLLLLMGLMSAAFSAAIWSLHTISAAQVLHQFYLHAPSLHIFRPRWYRFALLYGLVASFFIIIFTLQAVFSLLWVIATKWVIIGQRRAGAFDWDTSDYCQRWQLHLTWTQFIVEGGGAGGILTYMVGSVYFVWYLRALGAKIGKGCGIFPGGKIGLMPEPDLVEVCVPYHGTARTK